MNSAIESTTTRRWARRKERPIFSKRCTCGAQIQTTDKMCDVCIDRLMGTNKARRPVGA